MELISNDMTKGLMGVEGRFFWRGLMTTIIATTTKNENDFFFLVTSDG
jgi:hypothetical protein